MAVVWPLEMEAGIPQTEQSKAPRWKLHCSSCLALEVTSHHVHSILVVEEVASICPGWRGDTSDPTSL